MIILDFFFGLSWINSTGIRMVLFRIGLILFEYGVVVVRVILEEMNEFYEICIYGKDVVVMLFIL